MTSIGLATFSGGGGDTGLATGIEDGFPSALVLVSVRVESQ